MSNTSNEKYPQSISAFIAELTRRRVWQIAGAYIAGAWLGTEILNFLFEQFQAPGWAYRLLAIVFVVGFPISMVLAWVIQVGEDGRWSIDPSRGDYRTLASAIGVGLALTAGLSWLILPERDAPQPYEPLPDSLAVLPLSDDVRTQAQSEAMETLYRSLMQGLEKDAEITLIRLGPTQRPEDLISFGQSLGVETLGTLQLARTPNGESVEVELLDVVSETSTWSESYSWDPTRILETALAIANGMQRAMDLPVLSQDRFTGTSNAEAYQAYLRGEELAANGNLESLNRAIDEFQRAIDADPGFAQAHVALAQAIYDRLQLRQPDGDSRSELEALAREAVETAQKLDPDSPDALSLLGLGQDNRQMRIVAYERALELDPSHAITYFRYALQMQADGDLEEAERLMNRAVTLQPMNPSFRFALADILEQQGFMDRAIAERAKGEAFRR